MHKCINFGKLFFLVWACLILLHVTPTEQVELISDEANLKKVTNFIDDSASIYEGRNLGNKPNTFFGFSVALASFGKVLAVGGPYGAQGSVRVFKEENGRWSPRSAELLENGQFGTTISMTPDANMIAVGAPLAFKHGKVFIYQWDSASSSWDQSGKTLEGYGATEDGDQFGKALALTNEGSKLIIIGAGNGKYAQLYKLENKWKKVGEEIALTGQLNNNALSISGNGEFMAVGDSSADKGSGNVIVYSLLSSVPTQVGQTIVGDRGQQLGVSLCMSSDGKRIVVAAPFDWNSQYAGKVRAFEYDGVELWNQLGSDVVGKVNMDRMGYSATMSPDGTIIAMGAIGTGKEPGYARILKYSADESDWIQLGEDVYEDRETGFFGWSIASSGDYVRIAVGAPMTKDENGGLGKGLVSVFGVDR